MSIKLTQEIIWDVFIKRPTKEFKFFNKAYSICLLRIAGYTYKEIGKIHHISLSMARKYVESATRIYRNRQETTEEQAKRIIEIALADER